MTARHRTRAASGFAATLRSWADTLRSLADELSPQPATNTQVECQLNILVSLRGSERGLPVHYQLGLGLASTLEEEETRRDLVVPIRGVAGVDTLGIKVGWTPESVQHLPAGVQHRTI